jgi:hypothetical protein
MNEEHVPLTGNPVQEEELTYKNNRELFYSFDKEKNCYTHHVDYQCGTNQVIIKQGWDALEERIDGIRNDVVTGKLSPLAYYMELSQMEVTMLSQYAGIRKWRVKRHLTPKGFSKISPENLSKYSKALDVSVEKLIHPAFLTPPLTDRKEIE